MSAHIGILLPRSTEYPTMGIDLLDGFRLSLKQLGITDYELHTENTGFGEDTNLTYSRAEKLAIDHDIDLLVCYATSLNAEALYPFADSYGKPVLFLDAGMEIFELPPHPLCYHLTLQGLMACRLAGLDAAEGQRKVISASSFLDGGYRSSWVFYNAINEKGGTTCGHFVSHFKAEEFSVAQLDQQVKDTQPGAITAAFSSYLFGLFMNHLGKECDMTTFPPLYCSPFMGDEQLHAAVPFPGGTFHIYVPWATTLTNPANVQFVETIRTAKKKTANLFHLLGWEAALAAQQLIGKGLESLGGWSFESPRGTVHFHAETHSAYAPLYGGRITADEQGKCKLEIDRQVDVTGEAHRELHFSKIDGEYTRWKNNFFCI